MTNYHDIAAIVTYQRWIAHEQEFQAFDFLNRDPRACDFIADVEIDIPAREKLEMLANDPLAYALRVKQELVVSVTKYLEEREELL